MRIDTKLIASVFIVTSVTALPVLAGDMQVKALRHAPDARDLVQPPKATPMPAHDATARDRLTFLKLVSVPVRPAAGRQAEPTGRPNFQTGIPQPHPAGSGPSVLQRPKIALYVPPSQSTQNPKYAPALELDRRMGLFVRAGGGAPHRGIAILTTNRRSH